MKKTAFPFLFCIIAPILIAVLVSCSKYASSIKFSSDTYYIYCDENRLFTPDVEIAPKNASYTLTSSNTALLSVNEDNISVYANVYDSIVIITAISGSLSASANIIIYPTRGYSDPEVPDDKFHVYFETFGKNSQPSQAISPNGLVERPNYMTFQNEVVAEWYTETELINIYDFSKKVVNNFTLYAKWVPLDVTEWNYTTTANATITITGLAYPLLELTHLEIPTEIDGLPVTAIGDSAFYKTDTNGNRIDIKLVSLTIPGSVNKIGDNAFNSCSNLVEILFKDSGLETIGKNAFKGCDQLATLNFPVTLTAIGEGAFYGCKKYAPVLPVAITSILTDTFRESAITSLDLSSVTQIAARAFQDTTKLTTITPPSIPTDPSVRFKIDADSLSGSAWLLQKRSIAAVEETNPDTGLIFLDSKKEILLLCVKNPDKTHYSISVRIPSTVKYIAANAFPYNIRVPINNGIIEFTSQSPPKIEDYAISTSTDLALVVPYEYMSAYYSGINLTSLHSKICYKRIIDGLTILVHESSSQTSDTLNYYVYVVKYMPSNTPTIFNLRKLLFENFNSAVVVRKIKYGAFDGLLPSLYQLETIILPPKLNSIETSAFYNLPSFTKLYIYGTDDEYGSHTPSAAQVSASFISGIAPSVFRLLVPGSRLENYRTAWVSYVNSNIVVAGIPDIGER
jgi:hypothetical protein